MTLRAILLVLACAGFARAEEERGEAPLSLEELRERLAALETDYAADRERAAKAEARARQELEAMRARSRKLAEEVVTLRIEGHRLREDLQRLEAERKEQRDLAAALELEVGVVAAAFAALAEQLGFGLDQVPARDESAAQLSRSVAQLEEPSRRAAATASILDVVDHAHAEACSVTVRETTVRTATGEIEPVELLAVGHVAFAYRTLANRRIGIALSSPADASGYRWSEDLPPEHATGLGAAMDAVARGAREVAVPLDATGRLRVDTAAEGWDLRRLFEAGGPLMWPLGAVALLALMLIVERAVFLLWQGGRGEALQGRVLAACREGRFEVAQKSCAKARGMVARTLAACLRRRAGGQPAMEDSIQEQLLHDLPRLQRALGGIATLGAVAPLLGLLGTVTGIIQTFGVIKVYGNANPGLMAGGISEALVTTATGLVIAIPVLLSHSVLSGRVDLLVSTAEKSAATLLNTLAEER
ncbi:MAG: MotA/TolQ/ExbB proton channel family protein [Planctomycetota bacterium]